jgi:hypothetical protein
MPHDLVRCIERTYNPLREWSFLHTRHVRYQVRKSARPKNNAVRRGKGRVVLQPSISNLRQWDIGFLLITYSAVSPAKRKR